MILMIVEVRNLYRREFGNSLDEYFELLAMPRELIMFRSYFEKNGTTQKWLTLYRELSDEQKENLLRLVSLNVSELKRIPWPDDLKSILEFYLIKYSDEVKNSKKDYVQLSFLDDDLNDED